MWPAIAQTLDVPLGEDEPLSVAEYVVHREDLWQGIVARHDLAPNTLEQIVGESHHYADLCFVLGANAAPPPIYPWVVVYRYFWVACGMYTVP